MGESNPNPIYVVFEKEKEKIRDLRFENKSRN